MQLWSMLLRIHLFTDIPLISFWYKNLTWWTYVKEQVPLWCAKFVDYFFPPCSTALLGLSLIVQVSRSYSDTQTHTHSVGLLWTSDQPDTQTSTWQHTTLTTDSGRIRTRDPSNRAAVNPRLRPRGHWDLLCLGLCEKNQFEIFSNRSN